MNLEKKQCVLEPVGPLVKCVARSAADLEHEAGVRLACLGLSCKISLLQLLRDSEWTCRIYEGLAGIAHAWWADAETVLVTVDFQLLHLLY